MLLARHSKMMVCWINLLVYCVCETWYGKKALTEQSARPSIGPIISGGVYSPVVTVTKLVRVNAEVRMVVVREGMTGYPGGGATG